MSLLQALFLGLIQGLTEFLPVSSSGHLVLVPALLHWPAPGLAFTVAVHVGTLLAVLIYYRRDWAAILGRTGAWLVKRSSPAPKEAHLLLALVIGTIPGAVVGLTLESRVESMFNSVALVGAALVGTALVLLVAERLHRRRGQPGEVAWWQALVIGIAQAAAVIPGLSRSGMTIAAGLLCGLPRDWAARYAFLLSVPIILGAGAKESVDLLAAHMPAREWALLGAGALVSAASGLLAIFVVVRAVHNKRLRWFAVYCVAAAAAAFAISFAGH